MSVIDRQKWRVRVAPKKTLLVNALLSYLLITLPLFGSAFLLGAPHGMTELILTANIGTVLVGLLAYVRYRMAFVGVTEDRLVKRSYLGRASSVPLSSIATVVLVETYRTHATDCSPQLLICDAKGRRLSRMRGTFWTEKSMRAVADSLDRPLTQVREPMTTKEFFAAYPGSAYWFENRPALTALAVVVAFAFALVAVLGLMSLSGIPIVVGG